jgi:small subunit ribosomal protein S1
MAIDRRVSHPRQLVAVGDTVEVTVVELDAAKRRIGLSMVESARRAKESAETEERRDTDRVLAEGSARASLGTLGDLLARTKTPRR